MSWQSEPHAPGPSEVRPSERSEGGASDRPASGVEARSIGEVCAQTGLSPRTVRYYEELGLLPGVRRRAGGRRVYGPDAVERLRFILRLKALGVSLAEIRELNAVHSIGGSTGGMLRRLDELLGQKLAELDGRLDELNGLRAEIRRYKDRIATRIADRAGALRDAGGGTA